MKKIFFPVLALVVLGAVSGGGWFMFAHKKGNNVAGSGVIFQKQEVKPAKEPRVILSSFAPKQADAMFVRVLFGEKPLLKFDGRQIDFFETAPNDWLGIFGVDVKAKLESKVISIGFKNHPDVKEEIVIGAVEWPKTKLEINQKLAEQGYSPAKIRENIAGQENAIVSAAVSAYEANPYFSGRFRDPLGKRKVVGAYGNIRESNGVALRHLGVDLGAKTGDAVYAINDGVVTLSREGLPNYGTMVVIDHGLGIFSLYLHLSKSKVLYGEQVKKGDVIALAGSTGYSLEPHLHLSLRVRGASVDPLKFIDTFNAFAGGE